MILSTEKRFRDRYQFQASYTYARATDNLLNSNLGLGLGAQGGGAVPTDNLNLNFDRGNSDLSVRHTFVASGIALLPAGFSFSGVLRATSGAFFSASAAVSTDYDGDGIFSRRPPGTTRNQFTGPSNFNLDLRAEKSFRVGSGMDASLLVEGFNVTNAKNPRLIDASYVSGAPSATFGNVLVPLPGRELFVWRMRIRRGTRHRCRTRLKKATCTHRAIGADLRSDFVNRVYLWHDTKSGLLGRLCWADTPLQASAYDHSSCIKAHAARRPLAP